MRPTGPDGPSTAPQLLRLLRVEREPVARHLSAIAGWLTDHTASTALRCSLHANGYGNLLRRAQQSPPPIRSVSAATHRRPATLVAAFETGTRRTLFIEP
jgi:hypothetical protein